MMMIIKRSASYELRKLVYEVLKNDTVVTTREYLNERGEKTYTHVWDTVPERVKKPYVAVGKAMIVPDKSVQPKDSYIDIYNLDIDCFTHYGGKSQVVQMQDDCMAAIMTAWAYGQFEFDETSAFRMGVFEIGVRGEDVTVWGPKEAEHNIMTLNIQVIQVGGDTVEFTR